MEDILGELKDFFKYIGELIKGASFVEVMLEIGDLLDTLLRLLLRK